MFNTNWLFAKEVLDYWTCTVPKDQEDQRLKMLIGENETKRMEKRCLG